VKKRYLIIDAYNVIHSMSDLRKALKQSLENACDRLTKKSMWVHDAEDINTILVFDSNKESLEALYPLGEKKTFEIIYAPARLSADGVIEQLLTRIFKPERVTVVSNDGMVCESARVNQANVLSAREFYEWSDTCKERLEHDAVNRRQAFEKEWKNTIEFDL